jgi:transcription initiation factor TFIIE subunit alpha
VSPLREAYLYIVERAVAWEFDSAEYGKLARKMVELLLEQRESMTDDKIAIMLNVSTAEVRRILQYLMKHNLIGTKKRMTEDYRTEYTWYANDEVIRQAVRGRARAVREKLSLLIKALAEGSYYVCPNCFMRYALDDVMSGGDSCPVCGAKLEYVEGPDEIGKLTRVYEELEKVQG